jgi:hypothetical protein
VSNELSLIKWNELDTMIATARDAETLRGIRNGLQALEIMARQIEDSEKTINKIRAYGVRLAYSAARYYEDLDDERGRPVDDEELISTREGSNYRPTSKRKALEEQGISKSTIQRWTTAMHQVPALDKLAKFEQVCNQRSRELSPSGFVHFNLEPRDMEPVNLHPERLNKITVIVRDGEVSTVWADKRLPVQIDYYYNYDEKGPSEQTFTETYTSEPA